MVLSKGHQGIMVMRICEYANDANDANDGDRRKVCACGLSFLCPAFHGLGRRFASSGEILGWTREMV